jgi:hypothetical protein
VTQLGGINDYMIAKSAASANAKGSPNAFEATFAAHVSPTAFIVNRMSSADARIMAATLAKTPEGLRALQSIRAQMAYAKENGLFDMAK